MRRIAILAATAAITGLGLAGCNRNDQANSSSTSPPNAAERAVDKTGQVLSEATTRASELAQRAGASMGATTRGSSMAMAPDSGAILSTVDSVVNDAMSKNDFGSLIKNFTSAGQKQLGDYSKIDSTEMDGIIAQIRGDWQSKYRNDFKVPAAVLTTQALMVSQEYTPGGGVVSMQPGSNTPMQATRNINRNAGAISIAARDEVPALMILVENDGLIHGWRIAPPASLTAQGLHDDLLKQLTAVRNDKANWPVDQNAAYLMVTDHVLAAVANKTAQ